METFFIAQNQIEEGLIYVVKEDSTMLHCSDMQAADDANYVDVPFLPGYSKHNKEQKYDYWDALEKAHKQNSTRIVFPVSSASVQDAAWEEEIKAALCAVCLWLTQHKSVKMQVIFVCSRQSSFELFGSILSGEDGYRIKYIHVYTEQYGGLPNRFARKLEADIRYLLRSSIPGLKAVYLFGSCARGELRSSSDLDLLVVTKARLTDRMLAADMRETLGEERSGIRTDVVFMNEESMTESTVFKNAVNRDKVIILEVKQ